MPSHILITGVARGLGAELARRMEQTSGIGELIGLDLERPSRQNRGMRYVKADLCNLDRAS